MIARRCFIRRVCFVIAFALSVAPAVSLTAQTVLLDFGTDASFRGLSVPNPDANGNHWNSLMTGVFYSNLIDINNNPTTIDFGFSTPVATDSFNGPAGPTDAASLQFDVLATDIDAAALGNLGGAVEAAFDYVAGPDMPDNRVRFVLQQLDPTKKYNLTFFGSHKFSTDSTTVYSVYSDNTYSTLVGTASLDVQNPVEPFNMHNRDKVATISNLSPQTSNALYVQFVGSGGSLGYLNDMQIEGVTPVLTGDYNANGAVDAADYVLWRNNPSGFGGDPAGYNTWRANFGRLPGAGSGFGSGTPAAIPESASFVAVVVAAMIFSALRLTPKVFNREAQGRSPRRPHPG